MIEDCSKAIELSPQDAYAYYNRGLAYRELKKEEEAKRDFQRAQEIDPTVIVREESQKEAKKVADPLQKEIKETQEEVKETKEFQKVFRNLKNTYEKTTAIWFLLSVFMVILTSIAFLCAPKLANQYESLEKVPFLFYGIYIFLTSVTFIVIRRFTNSEEIDLEAENRLAMAKLFEFVVKTPDLREKYSDLIPQLADAMIYSMYKKSRTEKSSNFVLQEIKDGMKDRGISK